MYASGRHSLRKKGQPPICGGCPRYWRRGGQHSCPPCSLYRNPMVYAEISQNSPSVFSKISVRTGSVFTHKLSPPDSPMWDSALWANRRLENRKCRNSLKFATFDIPLHPLNLYDSILILFSKNRIPYRSGIPPLCRRDATRVISAVAGRAKRTQNPPRATSTTIDSRWTLPYMARRRDIHPAAL